MSDFNASGRGNAVIQEYRMSKELTYEISINQKEGYLHITAHGEVDLESIKRMYMAAVATPPYNQKLNLLWDFTDMNADNLSTEDIREIVRHIQDESLIKEGSYSAVLVNKDFMYGMVRMLQAIGDGILSPNIFVTKEPEEARKWITEKRDQDPR